MVPLYNHGGKKHANIRKRGVSFSCAPVLYSLVDSKGKPLAKHML